MVDGEGAGEHDEAGLGGRIDTRSRFPVEAGIAGDVDDDAAAAGDHVCEGRLHGEEDALEVRVDAAVPVVFARLEDRPLEPDAGGVDEDVEATVTVERLGHDALAVGDARDVAEHVGGAIVV